MPPGQQSELAGGHQAGAPADTLIDCDLHSTPTSSGGLAYKAVQLSGDIMKLAPVGGTARARASADSLSGRGSRDDGAPRGAQHERGARAESGLRQAGGQRMGPVGRAPPGLRIEWRGWVRQIDLACCLTVRLARECMTLVPNRFAHQARRLFLYRELATYGTPRPGLGLASIMPANI